MPMLEVAGKFRAKVLESNTYITRANTGTFQVAVPLEVIEGEHAGEHISAFLPITDNAIDGNAERLAEVFGYAGDLQDLYEGRCPFVGAECRIETEIDTYDGKQRCRVKWLNAAGGGFKQVEAADFTEFKRRFGGRFEAVAKNRLAQGGRSPVKAPPVAAPVGGGAPKPVAAATGTDDDLPF